MGVQVHQNLKGDEASDERRWPGRSVQRSVDLRLQDTDDDGVRHRIVNLVRRQVTYGGDTTGAAGSNLGARRSVGAWRPDWTAALLSMGECYADGARPGLTLVPDPEALACTLGTGQVRGLSSLL